MLPKIVFLSLFFMTTLCYGETQLFSKFSLRLGMNSHSFSQLESAFPGEDVGSGSSSVIVVQGEYEKFLSVANSYFLNVLFSGIGGEVEKTYSGTVGMKYYYEKFGTRLMLEDDNMLLTVKPGTSLFYGWEIGGVNSVYQVEEEVRSDLAVVIGGVLGASYSVDRSSSYSFELHVLKGTGVETDFLSTQVLFGMTYFLEPFF